MTTLAQSREVRKADPLLSEARKLARSTTSLHRKVRAMAATSDDMRALVRSLEDALRRRAPLAERTSLERDLLRQARELAP